MRGLIGVSFATLAYADGIAVICETEENPIKTMNAVENWCKYNKIELDKNKSGILVIKGKTKRKEINGISIVDTYKYLVINLSAKLNTKRHTYRDNKYKIR